MSNQPARTRAHHDEALHALLARLLAASLGDSANVGAYHVIVNRYPAEALLCAYETASNLPPAFVKKSRGAYFTWLLQRLCPNLPASSPFPSEAEPPASPPSAPTDSSAAST